MDSISSSQAPNGCTCGNGNTCGTIPGSIARRDFLKVAGIGLVSTTLGDRLTGSMAGPFGVAEVKSAHLIPEDKKLSPEWLRGLFERGVAEVFKEQSLDNIGMPCGGIGTGQLYLCGDGTLGCWRIFNNPQSNWVEGTFATYKHKGISKPVDQGFAVIVDSQDSPPVLKTLNREGFAEVSFRGEYPIGIVRYAEPSGGIEVEMEAFSPFIPLNAKDSALPATLFHISVKNISQTDCRASVAGWLENAVCCEYVREFDVSRRTQYAVGNGYALFSHSASEAPKQTISSARADISFERFEDSNYGAWQVEGNAFGEGPTPSTGSKVSGLEGKGGAASGVGGNSLQGTLISPSFIISRKYINFLIAGGTFSDATCINLLLEGRTVRSSFGRNSDTATWRSWDVGMWEGKEARLVIVDKTIFGQITLDQIEFSDTARADNDPILSAPDYGTMALACADAGPSDTVLVGPFPSGYSLEDFVGENAETYTFTKARRGLMRTRSIELAPGASHTFTFVLAWHFPNQANGDKFDISGWSVNPGIVGHEYSNRFADAGAVIDYVFQHHARLTGDTRLWRDSYYESSLPYWLLDRLHSTVSYLATGTCQWWKNGRFWAYEGVACCNGTCTHVWNYAQAHARLFPELARSIREMQDLCPQDNGGGFNPDTGLVGFRGDSRYAADGQCGVVLGAYREHTMSGNDSFLKKNWPFIKKATEYLISHDANADGIIEDVQPNTYDINYFGANTLVGALYLAALCAAEKMAEVVGDTQFARRARILFRRGMKRSETRLWNGEYYVQDVDLEKHPKDQYKDGCLSDQLFGQGWAHQLGLGYLYSPERVSKALDSVWKYNWAPDIAPYNEAHPPFRWFISPGQAGLITCTWPKGDYLEEGTRYREEVWTGIEYQVAGHMIWEGKLMEGLAVCRAVHDRYHPDLFNPYNEVECGDHYARAMASWGVYLALAGFQYDGPGGYLSLMPRMTPEDYRAVLTTSEAWVSFHQTRSAAEQHETLNVRWGELRLAQLAFGVAETIENVDVSLEGKAIEITSHCRKGHITIVMKRDILVQAGETLEVTLRY